MPFLLLRRPRLDNLAQHIRLALDSDQLRVARTTMIVDGNGPVIVVVYHEQLHGLAAGLGGAQCGIENLRCKPASIDRYNFHTRNNAGAESGAVPNGLLHVSVPSDTETDRIDRVQGRAARVSSSATFSVGLLISVVNLPTAGLNAAHRGIGRK